MEEEPEEYKKLPYLDKISLEKLVEIREAVRREGSVGLKKLIFTEDMEPVLRNSQTLYDIVRSLEAMPDDMSFVDRVELLADRLQQRSIIPLLIELRLLGIVDGLEIKGTNIELEVNCPRFLNPHEIIAAKTE